MREEGLLVLRSGARGPKGRTQGGRDGVKGKRVYLDTGLMTSWGEASGSQAGEGSATGSQSGRQGLGDRRGVQRQAGSQTGEDSTIGR